MFKFIPPVTLFLILSMFVIACGGKINGASTTQKSDQPLSASEMLFMNNGCVACHTVNASEETDRVGPSMVGLVTRVTENIKEANYTGQATNVEAYIHESIVDPGIYIVEGYIDLMPKTYVSSINEEDQTTLVNYLMTLE